MTTRTLVKKIERLDPIQRDILILKLTSVKEELDRFFNKETLDPEVWRAGWDAFNLMLDRLFPDYKKGRVMPAILDLMKVYCKEK